MATNDAIQNLIDHLIACDEQPDRENMTKLRQQLGHNVLRMKRRGRIAMFVCLGGGSLMLLGYLTVAVAASRQQDIPWLTTTAFTILILGALATVTGCAGLLVYRGFGYVWARHDFQETAITELSLQMQQLTERLDELTISLPKTTQ